MGRPKPWGGLREKAGIDDLRAFRGRLHDCFVRRADALFELCDAVLTASNTPSPAYLSLEAVHRRGWGSLYAALSKGGVDVSPWPRCDAEASPGPGYLYHPSRHSAGQPIVAGWAYQIVARLGSARAFTILD